MTEISQENHRGGCRLLNRLLTVLRYTHFHNRNNYRYPQFAHSIALLLVSQRPEITSCIFLPLSAHAKTTCGLPFFILDLALVDSRRNYVEKICRSTTSELDLLYPTEQSVEVWQVLVTTAPPQYTILSPQYRYCHRSQDVFLVESQLPLYAPRVIADPRGDAR